MGPFAIFGFLWASALLLSLLGIVAVVWVIYDVLTNQKRMPDTEKVVWILVALFLTLIGALLYYLIVKREREYEGEPGGYGENREEPIVY
ncbi:PLD nuclease N-terminal domain-containing protein [Thermococcus sp.]